MAKKKAKPADEKAIVLLRLKEEVIEVPIVGKTPLIPHRWSEKAKGMMPGHPAAEEVRQKLGKRAPEAEAGDCLYRLQGGRVGMPAVAFKAAIVGACRYFEKPSMVEAKSIIHVAGEGPEILVPIDYDEMVLREDTPRNTGGGADLRYRYMLVGWRAVLSISYVTTSITAGAIVTLVDAAGRGGVGDWRPSSPKSATGLYGTWRIAADETEEEGAP